MKKSLVAKGIFIGSLYLLDQLELLVALHCKLPTSLEPEGHQRRVNLIQGGTVWSLAVKITGVVGGVGELI